MTAKVYKFTGKEKLGEPYRKRVSKKIVAKSKYEGWEIKVVHYVTKRTKLERFTYKILDTWLDNNFLGTAIKKTSGKEISVFGESVEEALENIKGILKKYYV